MRRASPPISVPLTPPLPPNVLSRAPRAEMMHMTNAANVLNAIGGHPDIDNPGFIPQYPLELPILQIPVDLVWFTQNSVRHYQMLESVPPSGYNSSISMAYDHIVGLLTALCNQHGEAAVFTGHPSLQVNTSTSYGQVALPVSSLQEARAALIGIADQGGGCPVTGKPWPATSSLSSGPQGQHNSAEDANYSHAARYTEIIEGRSYKPGDEVGVPTGENRTIDWHNVRRFAPNPTVSDFLPEQCIEGGSWVKRNNSFFVRDMWATHGHHLNTTTVDTWEECAHMCEAWTVDANMPLAPCAMWTWVSKDTTIDGQLLSGRSCLLAQGGGPVTTPHPGVLSGCQYGTVCNHTLPGTPLRNSSDTPPSPQLAKQCEAAHNQGMEFAGNYTSLLVALHNTFNGKPEALMPTIGQMYMLKGLAINMMDTPDPRIRDGTMGTGPPWEYVASASQYEARGRKPFPIVA